MKSEHPSRPDGSYHHLDNIPVDKMNERSFVIRRGAEGETMEQMMKTLKRMEKQLEAVSRAREEDRKLLEEQLEELKRSDNQLKDLVNRTGRIERLMGSDFPLSSGRRSSTVTSEELSKEVGSVRTFWIAPWTGGTPSPQEVRITGEVKRASGVRFECEKVEGGRGAGPRDRSPDEFFRTKEEAENAPRPSAKKTKNSFSAVRASLSPRPTSDDE